MAPDSGHERFTSDNADLLSGNVWEDDDSAACPACGALIEESDSRCRACGSFLPVCVGACAACMSPVCVGSGH